MLKKNLVIVGILAFGLNMAQAAPVKVHGKKALGVKSKVPGQKKKASLAPVPQIVFNKSDCRKIAGEPNLYVCVDGKPNVGVLDENMLRTLKGTAKNLINSYKASRRLGAVKFMSTGMSCEDYNAMMTPAPTSEPADPCMMDPMLPGCPGAMASPPPTDSPDPSDFASVVPPTASTCTFSDWDPMECGYATYCDDPMHSMETICGGLTTSTCTFADWDPIECGYATYCDDPMHSMETICGGLTTSTCTFADWDPIECGYATYCDDPMHSMETICGGLTTSTCTFADWDPIECGYATYCDDPMHSMETICGGLTTSTCTFADWDPIECGYATYCDDPMHSMETICGG